MLRCKAVVFFLRGPMIKYLRRLSSSPTLRSQFCAYISCQSTKLALADMPSFCDSLKPETQFWVFQSSCCISNRDTQLTMYFASKSGDWRTTLELYNATRHRESRAPLALTANIRNQRGASQRPELLRTPGGLRDHRLGGYVRSQHDIVRLRRT